MAAHSALRLTSMGMLLPLPVGAGGSRRRLDLVMLRTSIRVGGGGIWTGGFVMDIARCDGSCVDGWMMGS